jgi:hypothetical protein
LTELQQFAGVAGIHQSNQGVSMNRIPRLAVCALAVASCALIPTAYATPSLPMGSSFDLRLNVDDGVGGTVPSGPFAGTVGTPGDDYFSQADVQAAFTAGSTDYDVRVNWVDGDSFDLYFQASGAIDLNQLSITLSGLDFKDNGASAPIIAVSFSRAGSNVDEFNAGPQMPDPSTSFTAQSVTASFGFMPLELAADGPRLRFDVQAAAAVPVPEPSTLAMLLGGLALLGRMRRRQARR